MGKVSNIICCAGPESEPQFNYHICCYEPLGFDGERNGYDEQLVVGVCHAVTQQYSVNGTRRTYGERHAHQYIPYNRICNIRIAVYNELKVHELAEFLCKCCAQSAQQIEYEETF